MYQIIIFVPLKEVISNSCNLTPVQSPQVHKLLSTSAAEIHTSHLLTAYNVEH